MNKEVTELQSNRVSLMKLYSVTLCLSHSETKTK